MLAYFVLVFIQIGIEQVAGQGILRVCVLASMVLVGQLVSLPRRFGCKIKVDVGRCLESFRGKRRSGGIRGNVFYRALLGSS